MPIEPPKRPAGYAWSSVVAQACTCEWEPDQPDVGYVLTRLNSTCVVHRTLYTRERQKYLGRY